VRLVALICVNWLSVYHRPSWSIAAAAASYRGRRFGVGVDEGLLVDAADALQVADVERILSAAIARALQAEPRSAPGRPGRSLLPAP